MLEVEKEESDFLIEILKAQRVREERNSSSRPPRRKDGWEPQESLLQGRIRLINTLLEKLKAQD